MDSAKIHLWADMIPVILKAPKELPEEAGWTEEEFHEDFDPWHESEENSVSLSLVMHELTDKCFENAIIFAARVVCKNVGNAVT